MFINYLKPGFAFYNVGRNALRPFFTAHSTLAFADGTQLGLNVIYCTLPEMTIVMPPF
jgi:hypothetical protein